MVSKLLTMTDVASYRPNDSTVDTKSSEANSGWEMFVWVQHNFQLLCDADLKWTLFSYGAMWMSILYASVGWQVQQDIIMLQPMSEWAVGANVLTVILHPYPGHGVSWMLWRDEGERGGGRERGGGNYRTCHRSCRCWRLMTYQWWLLCVIILSTFSHEPQSTQHKPWENICPSVKKPWSQRQGNFSNNTFESSCTCSWLSHRGQKNREPQWAFRIQTPIPPGFTSLFYSKSSAKVQFRTQNSWQCWRLLSKNYYLLHTICYNTLGPMTTYGKTKTLFMLFFLLLKLIYLRQRADNKCSV